MIKVKDLKIQYAYGPSFTVKNASFDTGLISCIIGRNGSGKSTLLKAFAGQAVYTGSVLIGDDECRNLSFVERAKRVSYLPQHLKSVNLDVRTLTEHGRYPYQGSFRKLNGEDNDHIDRALEITGMKDLQQRNVQELSGGERQRAYLAMVIAQNSGMILLDEPSTYMDQLYREEFFHILKTLSEEGKGIVMVCHELEPAFAYSDRIFLMEERELAPGMSPEELSREEETLLRNFKVAVKRSEDTGSFYPYVMKRPV